MVESISVVGPDANRFLVFYQGNNIQQGDWIRIKVEFSSFERMAINKLDAHIEIRIAPDQVNRVQIGLGATQA